MSVVVETTMMTMGAITVILEQFFNQNENARSAKPVRVC